MITPPFLKLGDSIGITCPAGFVSTERIFWAKKFMESNGFKVHIGQTVGTQCNYFSANDHDRLTDLQNMLDNPDIKMIWMGRGGYGMSRIIDKIDFTQFCKTPKWIVGFSDITVLHAHIQANFGIETMHAPMSGSFKEDNWQDDFIQFFLKNIKGESTSFPKIPTHSLNKSGHAIGELVGGNLAILAHLTGSKSQINTTEKILFIEDVGEYKYNLDRMFLNLKRSGWLDDLAGLVCGGWTALEDTTVPFGATAEEIIDSHLREYNFPVCYNLPSGHVDENYTLILGRTYSLSVESNSIKFDSL